MWFRVLLIHIGLLKFNGNDSLADITLTKAAMPDDPEFKAHKVVLASSSDLFFNLFTTENQELVLKFKIPPLVETKSSMAGDPYSKAFAYMYCDQTFAKIKDELSPNNVFQLYSVAYTLKIKKLINDLEHLIVTELLDSENCINFYLDAIRFDSKRITDACEKLLIREFHDVCSSKDGHYFLSQLPLEYFKSLMKDSELNVDNETKVLECVEKYIRHRKDIKPDQNQEEKKLEKDAKIAAGEEVKDELEEEKAKKDEEFKALDDQGKIQWKYTEEVDQMRKQADDRMRVRGLRPHDKKELFKTIRFAFLTHQELLKCSRDPIFDEAKEYLVEGLTYKIEPEEVLDKEDTIISLNERAHYQPQYYDEDQTDLHVRAPQHHKLNQKGLPHREDQYQEASNRSQHSRSEMNNKHKHDPAYKSPNKPTRGQKHGSTRAPGHQPQGHHLPSSTHQDQYYGKGANGRNLDKNQLSYPPRHVAPMGMDDTFARADPTAYDHTGNAPHPPMKFGVPGQGKTKTHGPQSQWGQKQLQKTAFEYSYDFDENGSFYYLGTHGDSKIWQNPHSINQVQAFASSIGFGSVQDFVGRKCVNLRTLNEPFSFFGVDMGEGRKLLPTCYTIMNRNSSSHVLMNWHLEGSNDKLNWTILDRRVYMPDQLESGDYQHEYIDEELLESLCQKQGTNTWGVDQNVFQDIDDEGFRFFRIIQISPNSSGSDNLALSCMELYGKIVTGRFP